MVPKKDCATGFVEAKHLRNVPGRGGIFPHIHQKDYSGKT
jgi:hypothetical protein